MMAVESPRPDSTAVSWKEKLSYGLGDAGFNFYSTNIATFLMIFYTDVFGLTAVAAGSVLSLVKMITVVTPPIIGSIADRTETRFGKFRPYMLWLALPLAVTGVLAFSTPDLSSGGKLAYAYVTYLLLITCYTAMNIPYNALSGVMSSDPQQRTSINSVRFIMAFGGSTLVTAASPFLVKWLGNGNERSGWGLTMAVWGVAACGFFFLTFFNTRERVLPPPAQQTNAGQDIKDLLKSLPWLVLFFMSLTIMITATLRGSVANYYLKYYVQRPELIAAFVPAYMAAAAVGASLAPLLTRHFDRKLLLILLMSATGVFSCGFYFIPKDQIGWMFALQIAIGLTLGPKAPLTFAMYADTADYNEWRNGRRATAMTFAAATFSGKLGIAVASLLTGLVLGGVGYVANTLQTEKSQTGILLLISFVPAAFAFIAALGMILYKLDSGMMTQIRTDLAARQKASGLAADSPAS